MTSLLDRATLRRSYERSAETYDVRFRDVQREKFAVMLAGGVPLGRAPWLDLGCGTGLLAAYLAERGHDPHALVGLDFSRAMLARARARGLAAAEGEIDVLPFRDAAFGAVLAFTSLRIVSDPESERRTLAEIGRVLAPGGVFVLTVLRASHDSSLAAALQAAGFQFGPACGCGQDVGYRCVRA
ncbi:MAG: class I SAM-dependent methyltransferase [Deltaproteobacteria bacterium]|nr:class I SAM-dependent methyltransferase [Deltaproteobacteria bacterium]